MIEGTPEFEPIKLGLIASESIDLMFNSDFYHIYPENITVSVNNEKFFVVKDPRFPKIILYRSKTEDECKKWLGNLKKRKGK